MLPCRINVPTIGAVGLIVETVSKIIYSSCRIEYLKSISEVTRIKKEAIQKVAYSFCKIEYLKFISNKSSE
jgi:hypothetical protein